MQAEFYLMQKKRGSSVEQNDSWRHFLTLPKPPCSFSKQNEFRLSSILNDLQMTIQNGVHGGRQGILFGCQ
jgi:hypothetical protein